MEVSKVYYFLFAIIALIAWGLFSAVIFLILFIAIGGFGLPQPDSFSEGAKFLFLLIIPPGSFIIAILSLTLGKATQKNGKIVLQGKYKFFYFYNLIVGLIIAAFIAYLIISIFMNF